LATWSSALAIASHARFLENLGAEGFGENPLRNLERLSGAGGIIAVIIGLVLAIIAHRLIAARKINLGPTGRLVIPFGAALLFVQFVLLLFPSREPDIKRLALFKEMFLPVIAVALVIFLVNAVVALVALSEVDADKSDKPKSDSGRNIFGNPVAWIVLPVCLYYLFDVDRFFYNFSQRTTRFLAGESSAHQYADFFDQTCTNISNTLPQGTKAIDFFFMPYCYNVPNVRILNPTVNELEADFAPLIYGSAEEAAAIYRAHNVRHFIFHRARIKEWASGHVLSPLFDSENLVKYFRGKNIAPEGLVLILDGTDADGQTLNNEDFLRNFEEFRKFQRRIAWGKAKSDLEDIGRDIVKNPGQSSVYFRETK
jgi:hypothetical protein